MLLESVIKQIEGGITMGELVKKLARREGITLSELAERVGKKISSLSMNLKSDIKLKDFKKYAEALGYKIIVEKDGERIEV